jgi:hypothetical protein
VPEQFIAMRLFLQIFACSTFAEFVCIFFGDLYYILWYIQSSGHQAALVIATLPNLNWQKILQKSRFPPERPHRNRQITSSQARCEMTSIDNGIDIPASSRLSQVGTEILAEQARHALADESIQTRLKLNLSPEKGFYGPEAPGPAPIVQTNGSDLPAAGTFKITPSPLDQDGQRLSDSIADKVYPGFGRIESPNQSNPWRLDYVDPSRCKTKASVGLCFTMDLR